MREKGFTPIVVAIKLLHTLIWLFFVACIAAVPIAAALHKFRLAAFLAGLVLLECLVLVLNRWRCPITDVAARYAPETSENFDIYLPNWLARHNKTIFGVLFLAGGLFALAQWLFFGR
jgi:hypothetical protein